MKSVLFTFIVTVMVISLSLSQERQFLEKQEVFGNVSRLPGSNANSSDYDVAMDVVVDNQGNVYVSGPSRGSGTGLDYATVKYNASGVEHWVARYNGPGNANDWATALMVDNAGNVYVTGYSESSSGTNKDYATVKYNTSGVEQWVARYNGPGNADDWARSLVLDGGSNVYVTGRSVGSGTDEDYATIKYNASGEQQWVARYNGLANFEDVATAVAVDGAGNVYVTGWSGGSGPGLDYATIKYNASGGEQWVAHYNGPGNYSVDGAYALAVDGAGNVYVTGGSSGSGTDEDYATVKYNASGVEQWAVRYNGSGNSRDAANALAVDGQGNVYVTGISMGSGAGFDYATIKYSTATGDTLWVRRYDGPANSDDGAFALAVDGMGNVYVTGRSGGSSTDYATIKYDASGIEQWVARYNGPGNAVDWANALVVDSAGNVYVTGYSVGSGIGYDYATIKYNASGEEQWVVRYDGLRGSAFIILLIQGSDDAGENPNCSYSTSSNEIYFGECSNGENIVSGFRFQNFPISSPNEIQSAHLEFTVDGIYSNDIEIEFFGEASGNAQTFSDNSKPSDRPLTTQSVRWILNSSEVWSVGEKKNSPDLMPIIREIVERPGWQRGNALSIIVKNFNIISNGNHRRVFAVEREGQLKAAKLIVNTAPQGDFAVVKGTVVESGSNAPIAGATVFLRPVVTGGSATTDPDGQWRMTIPGGRGYELRILADGYEMIEERQLNFPKGTTTTLLHEMIPYVPAYDEYRIVPVALAPNPDILEIPEGGTGYAWFVVEGLKNGTWLPVPDANIQYSDAEGNVKASKSNQLFYTFLTMPFHFQNAGVFSVVIPANMIQNGTPGSQERITVFSVNYQVLPLANQASITAKVVSFEYTASWGYRIYQKGGLGVTAGIATGTAFVGGGSGATIEIDLAGLNSNPDWSVFKVLRRIDVFGGVEAGLKPPKLINIEVGLSDELKVSFPYQEEYSFDLDHLQGLEALMAFYLFLEPMILLAGEAVPGGQFAATFLSWTTEVLILNSGENGLAIVRTADEVGLDIESSITLGAKLGIGKVQNLKLGLGASSGIKTHLGGSIRSTAGGHLQQRLNVVGEYDKLKNIGPQFVPETGTEYKFLYLPRLRQPAFPEELHVGYEILGTWQGAEWRDTKFTASLGSNSNLLNLYHLPGQLQEHSFYLLISDEAVNNTLLNLTNLPTKMWNIGQTAVDVVVDNSDFKDDVVHFLGAIYDQQNYDLPVQVGYGFDAEDRNELQIDLDLELPLGTPVVLNLGGGIEGTESREYHLADGFWVEGLPYFRQEMPNPPLPRVKFKDVIQDLWQQITSPGNVWEELKEVISKHISRTSLTETTTLSLTERSVQLNALGSTLTLRSGSIPSGLDSAFCLYYEWEDEPVNRSISSEKRNKIQEYQRQLRRVRQQAAGLHYGIGGFFRLQPLDVQFQDSTLLTIVYSDSEVVGLDENNLAVYWENTQGIWRYLPSINKPDSNKVAAWIPEFRTYTLAPRIPQGSFGVSADPDTLPADGVSTATITSELLYNNDGSLIADGSLFTVTASRGRILSSDVNTTIAGIQIAVVGGMIHFEFQADSLSYPVLLTAHSLEGTAAGEMELPLYDVATPRPPTLLSAEPAENGIKITWQSAGDFDLAGYRIWFDTDTSGAPYNGTATVFGEDSPVTVGATDEYILSGLSQDSTYFIAVTALDISGKESDYSNELSIVTAIENPEEIQLPEEFSLDQNYPNPFNPITTIQYTILKSSPVKIHIFDILGQKIKELVNETQEPGVHKVNWDGTNDTGIRVASGVYFYRIQASEYVKVRKMILVR